MRTLSNAVATGKVHHAYLFVGSRGTGKTSVAKILAACLDCEQGPTVEPCGVCESCRSIAAATSLDVIEMDAASNNSVDDIRELRESVAFAPVSGRHKVYILDEAHMLSPQAWNAFLKTLEEPPPSTVFVLATTEAQKVLPTVVDRCHRFDFHRPTAPQIAEVVSRTAAQESIALDPPCVGLIARGAGGSFRDALGTLEQLVTYAGTTITLDDVLAVLGVADSELLFECVEAVVDGDPGAALRAAARLAGAGRDPGQAFRDLEDHARELLVVQVLGEVPEELALTPERDDTLSKQAARVGRADVVRLLDNLAAGLEAVKNGSDARIMLELALVKAAAPELDPSAKALLVRVERLEAQLGGEPAPASTPIAPAPEPVPAPVPEPAATAAQPAPAAPEPPAPAPEPTTAPQPGPTAPIDLDTLVSLWPAVIDYVRSDNGMLAEALAQARPAAASDTTLVVAFPESAAFLRKLAESRSHRDALGEALAAVLGRRLTARFELRDGVEPVAQAAATAGVEADPEALVARLKAEFDAEEILEEGE